MTDTGPAKTHCAYCLIEQHLRCRWLTSRIDCGCACPWLVADVLTHHPSLRQTALEDQ